MVLKAHLTVRDGTIDLDFSGTSPCSRYGVNVPINYTAAYSVFALRCVIGGVIPNNAGSLSPFRVSAPAGSIPDCSNTVQPAAAAPASAQFVCIARGLCGSAPGRARARTGRAAMISGYLGTSDRFDRAMEEFAVAYAEQNELNYPAVAERDRGPAAARARGALRPF